MSQETDSLSRLSAALADRYRIERELGQGGMATVYLAEDSKHKRKVALKVLRPELAAMLGAERFVQEITTTAALQHPHILPLFDSGTADGFLYYVMPYIEGETLRTKLDRETQLGTDAAVRIAREVADALDYAHRHGVIHRDIKPENILLHDGRPMVADFGIALALSAAAGGRMTETGMSLGTPHYMSPEQATAEKEITARSDVYSLGSVLYEMLAGQPPHLGGSAQQIIMKIIAEPVAPVTALRKSVPPNVAAAVAKSLEKLPADRFATAAEFAAALGDSGFAAARGPRGAAQRPGLLRGRRTLAAATVLLAMALAGWAWKRRAPVAEGRPWRVVMTLPDSAPVGQGLSLSADGSVLVWDGGGRVWMRSADATEPFPIPGADKGEYPVLSPDGRRVAFDGGARGLIVSGLDGSAPRRVVPFIPLSVPFGWTDDDHVVYSGLQGLVRAPISGGATERLTTTDSVGSGKFHLESSGLPDGGVVFTAGDGDSTVIAAVGPRGGAFTKLMGGLRAVYAPPHYLIVTRDDGTIVAVPFDASRRRLTGTPVPIASGLHSGSFSAVGRATVSATGRLVYVATGWGHITDPMDLVWVARGGAATPASPGWTGLFLSVAVSRDGARAAASLEGDKGDALEVRDLTSGAVRAVAIRGSLLRDPVFSADGRWLYFVALGASQGVYRIATSGTAAPEPVISAEFTGIGHTSITPDGDVYFAKGMSSGSQILRQAAGDQARQAVPFPVGNAMQPEPSPDGRWLAFTTPGASEGQREVHVRSTDTTQAQDWRVTALAERTTSIRWARDGRELFFISRDSMVGVPVTARPSFGFGAPRALFAVTGLETRFDIGRDGRFLMIRRRHDLRAPTQLVMLERWTDLLPR